MNEWLNGGGSVLPFLELLAGQERWIEVGCGARLALAWDDAPEDTGEKRRSLEPGERARVEEILEQAGNPPSGWKDALTGFAADPSLENWEELMQFTPHDVFYQRMRNSILFLRKLGLEPNLLFRCSARFGMIPETIELAESGAVDPQTIEQRAIESGREATGLWLGLAAEAAFARGDTVGMMRYLQWAYSRPDWFAPDMSVWNIQERCDPDTRALLERLGCS